jgi:hypothetical protein
MESIDFEELKAAGIEKRYDEKWEVYRIALEKLYLDCNLSVPAIRTLMIEKLDFKAE